MQRLIFMLLALATLLWPGLAAADDPVLDARWLKSTEVYTRKGETWFLSEVFGNTYTGQFIPAGCATENNFCVVDLKPSGVAADAKAAFIQGLLIITAGSDSPPAIANLTIAFRRPGDPAVTCAHYLGQAVIATFTGERTNFSSWVPLVDGKFEFCWRRTTHGTYPAVAAYGFNMGAQAWVK